MFGKLFLILATLGNISAHQNRYLRGPGNSTVLVAKTNMSNALVPYTSNIVKVKPLMCPIKSKYYWSNIKSNTSNFKDL